MTEAKYLELLHKYEKCPCCGGGTAGNGDEALKADIHSVSRFYRKCPTCSWTICIEEGLFSALYPNPPKEVPGYGKA